MTRRTRTTGQTGHVLHSKALPPFAALRAFEAVGRAGGVRKAAAMLSLDHTVVSRHLRSLEDWLGVALFQRLNGHFRLTEAGEEYHRKVSTALVDLALATATIMQDSDSDYLRVWCIPGLAAQWLSYQLTEFERLMPTSRVELRPTDTAANLAMAEADVDIRYYGDDWLPKPGGDGLHYIEIARPPIMIVASPEVADRLSALTHISELVGGPLLHEEHDEQWRAWFALNGVAVPERLDGPLLWHAHMAIAAARQGRGVALASLYLVGDDLANGTLVELKLPGAKQVVLGGYAFVTRADRWTSPLIAQLRRFLQSKVF